MQCENRFGMMTHFSRGMLNQYSGFIFFFPYAMIGVDMPAFLFSGLPMRKRRYSGGVSFGWAGFGMSSVRDANKQQSL